LRFGTGRVVVTADRLTFGVSAADPAALYFRPTTGPAQHREGNPGPPSHVTPHMVV